MYGNCRLYNSSAAQNDSIEFDVVLGPGTWSLRPVFNKGPDQGIVTVTMAFASKFFQTTVGTFDCYSASQVLNSATILSSFNIRGRKTARVRLRFAVADKNAASTGYQFSEIGWSLKRTDY